MYDPRDYDGDNDAQTNREWWEEQALVEERLEAERAALALRESVDETDEEYEAALAAQAALPEPIAAAIAGWRKAIRVAQAVA